MFFNDNLLIFSWCQFFFLVVVFYFLFLNNDVFGCQLNVSVLTLGGLSGLGLMSGSEYSLNLSFVKTTGRWSLSYMKSAHFTPSWMMGNVAQYTTQCTLVMFFGAFKTLKYSALTLHFVCYFWCFIVWRSKKRSAGILYR